MKHYQNNDNCTRGTLSIYLFHIPNSLSYFDNLYSTFNLRCLFLKMKLHGEEKKKRKKEKKDSYYREKRWLFSGTISSP